jgi:parvulin-like peptidyl-prolyl isomerase
LADKQEPNQNIEQVDKQGGPKRLWPALIGAAGGAIVVGAIWAIMASLHPSDPLVATVGSDQIHQSAFHNQLESQSGSQTLEQMIEEQLIKEGAKEQHITATKQEISQQQQAIEAQEGITSGAQLAAFLQQSGMTQAQFNDIVTVNVLEQKLAENGVKVTNQEITDYYNKNKSSFTPSGSKTPEPLSKVRSQVIAAVKQSKATPAAQLIASLAKKQNITIHDAKYSDLKSQIENPSTQQSSGLTSSTGQ